MKKLMLFFVVVVLGLLPFVGVIAQTDKPVRVEFELASRQSNFYMVPLHSHGVVVFSEMGKYKRFREWHYHYLNNNLQPLYSAKIYLPKKSVFQASFADDAQTYSLFSSSHSKQKDSATVVSFSSDSVATGTKRIYFPEAKYVTQMLLLGNNYFFVCQDNHNSYLFFYDSQTNTRKDITPLQSGYRVLQYVGVDSTKTKLLLAYIVYDGQQSENRLHISTFNADGSLVGSVEQKAKDGGRFVRFAIAPMAQDSLLVAGTYRSGLSPVSLTDYRAGELFTFFVANNTVGKANYFPLTPPLQTIAGNENLSVERQVLISSLQPYRKGGLLAVETFLPQYTTEYVPSYGYTMSPVSGTYRTVLEGYVYDCAYLFGLDSVGKRIWQNIFPLNGSLNAVPSRMLTTFLDNDDILTVYNYDSKLVSMVSRADKKLSSQTITKIPLLNSYETLLVSEGEDIIAWYDQYLLSYGYQRLRNLRNNRKHFVFYLNKMAFR